VQVGGQVAGFVQIDIGHVELGRQRLGDVFFLAQFEFDQGFAIRLLSSAILERIIQRLLPDDVPTDEDFADFLALSAIRLRFLPGRTMSAGAEVSSD